MLAVFLVNEVSFLVEYALLVQRVCFVMGVLSAGSEQVYPL